MCDPVTAVGLALSAGGTYLQSREAARNEQRVTNAKNAAFVENINRNNQFAAEAGAQAKRNVQGQSREAMDEDRQAEAEKQIRAFNDIRTQPDYNIDLADATPKNVVIARKQAADDANQKTDRDVANQAALSGYGGALFNSGLGQTEFSRLFGNIQDKAGANTRLLPLEMSAAANNASKSPSLFPTLMKAAGTGLSLYGSAGGSFSNTIEGARPTANFIGPMPSQTSYGLFMNNKPVDLFGYQLAGRYS